jgi:hypothetical protein
MPTALPQIFIPQNRASGLGDGVYAALKAQRPQTLSLG